jgi:hypothetical protein
MAKVLGMIVGLVLLATLCGCGDVTLPRIDPGPFDGRLPSIPGNAAPILSWAAEEGGLRTYYYEQRIKIAVRAWLPDSVTLPRDIYWQVEARNHEGKILPFLGITEYRMDPKAKRAYPVLVPEIDIKTVPDGLYILLEPKLELDNGRVKSIRLIAAVREIRNHLWKPFRYPIAMTPLKPSELTPMPPPKPEPEPGTPIPYN